MENSAAPVTGASKGIGKEIARQLAAAGLAVWVGSRDAARGERAAGEIGGDARLLVLDVTDAASIVAAACQAGTLDILVNNAGISGDGKTADRDDAGTFRRIYETNVFGVVAVTNAFCTSIGPEACVPGGAEVGGLAAAVAEGLAVAGVDGEVGDCTVPGLDDPQPVSATSATSVAAVTGKRLLMSPGRRSPPPGSQKAARRRSFAGGGMPPGRLVLTRW